MTQKTEPSESTSSCRFCRSGLNEGAIVCHECNRDQRFFWSRLQVLVAVAAICAIPAVFITAWQAYQASVEAARATEAKEMAEQAVARTGEMLDEIVALRDGIAIQEFHNAATSLAAECVQGFAYAQQFGDDSDATGLGIWICYAAQGRALDAALAYLEVVGSMSVKRDTAADIICDSVRAIHVGVNDWGSPWDETAAIELDLGKLSSVPPEKVDFMSESVASIARQVGEDMVELEKEIESHCSSPQT